MRNIMQLMHSFIFVFLNIPALLKAEPSGGYYSFLVGNPADVETNPTGITFCQGGSTWVDSAFATMLRYADGKCKQKFD